MGTRSTIRKIEVPVMFEVWVDAKIADCLDANTLAKVLIREGIEGADEAYDLHSVKGEAQLRKVRLRARKMFGISASVPDAEWIQMMLKEHGYTDEFRVQRNDGGRCSFSQDARSWGLHKADCDMQSGAVGHHKWRDLETKVSLIDDKTKRITQGTNVAAFLGSIQMATCYVSPLRWTVMHRIAHRLCAGSGKWHSQHDSEFWMKFYDLVAKFIPQACTKEAMILEALNTNRIVS